MADGIPLVLDPASVKVIDGAGDAFASGNVVRFVPKHRAPKVAGDRDGRVRRLPDRRQAEGDHRPDHRHGHAAADRPGRPTRHRSRAASPPASRPATRSPITVPVLGRRPGRRQRDRRGTGRRRRWRRRPQVRPGHGLRSVDDQVRGLPDAPPAPRCSTTRCATVSARPAGASSGSAWCSRVTRSLRWRSRTRCAPSRADASRSTPPSTTSSPAATASTSSTRLRSTPQAELAQVEGRRGQHLLHDQGPRRRGRACST